MNPDMPATGQPAVSVVMATYNGKRYLAEQLDSIANQTRRPDELLIIDDASSDGTPEFLAAWARDKPWARIERNPENLGINGTFYRLLTESRGKHVFIADQDDVWLPGKIERMLASAGDASLTFSDASMIDGEGRPLRDSELERHAWRVNEKITGYFFVYGNYISGHNMMVSRELITRTPPPPHASVMMYDQWIALSAMLHKGIAEVPVILCRHRIHASNANNNRALKKAAAAGQGRKERAQFRLKKRDGIYAALSAFAGQDAAFDAFVREAQEGSRNLVARYWSAALFAAIWRRRQLFFPGAGWRKMLRRSLKLSLGGKSWFLI
ncbi:MAG: glycosyltransferase [Pseudomonadota bacterium]